MEYFFSPRRIVLASVCFISPSFSFERRETPAQSATQQAACFGRLGGFLYIYI